MREVRATVDPSLANDVARVARESGASEALIYHAYAYGAEAPRAVVSIETSTPVAKTFLDRLREAPFYSPDAITITSRDLRAIVSAEPISSWTQPIVEPPVDVEAELWQSSHVTLSFAVRAAGGAALLSYGLIHDSLLMMIGGLLFTPFLVHALAISLGASTRDWRLAGQGIVALIAASVITFAAGAFVAEVTSAPLAFDSFRSIEVSLVLSLAIGAAAGMATADDAGRRSLIGLAAASQVAIYVAWFGIVAVRGDVGAGILRDRAISLGLNMLGISATAALTYAVLGMDRAWLGRLLPSNRGVRHGRGAVPPGT